VANTPLALGAVIAAGLIRTDEEKRSDRFRAICDGHWVSGKGKDGRSWWIVREGEGYIVQAGKGSPALQYFRPEQGRTWSRGEAADRLVELADAK
jgi:hypothetical protein